jgi:hypothetical protein
VEEIEGVVDYSIKNMGNCIDGKNSVTIQQKEEAKKAARSRGSKARTSTIPSYPSIEDVLREGRINKLRENSMCMGDG